MEDELVRGAIPSSYGPSFGATLAIVGAISAGVSMVLQKVGVTRSQVIWFCGLACLIIGEVLTVAAFTYAPAVLVSPLGAFRVIVTAILSTVWLKERLSRNGKLGILLSIIGATMIVYNAPKSVKIKTFADLEQYLLTGRFAIFVFGVLAASFYLSRLAKTQGSRNIYIYVTICNLLGSLGVLLSKGIGIVVQSILGGEMSIILNPLAWAVILGVAYGAVSQLYYLNHSLRHFDAAQIGSLKYVGTNALVVIGSVILFDEFASITTRDMIGLFLGLSTVAFGTTFMHGSDFYCKSKKSADVKNQEPVA